VVTVNLLAVFETWKSAGQWFGEASQALAKAADQLCDELTAAGAAWGHDELGQAFFNGGGGKPGFGSSRDHVLPQIGDMVNVLAGTGDALVAAGAEYLRAEQSNTRRLGGKPGGGASTPAAGGSTYHLPPFTGGMVANDPPPGGLEWMMNLVASLVAGCEWPDGSIGGLEQISGALSGMATALGQAVTDVGDASAQVTGSNVGQGPENFAAFCGVLVQALEQLQQACKGLATSVDNLIAQKKAAWIQLTASMVFLVASFFVAQALAVWTLGASEAEFFATAEAEGWTLRMLFRLLAKGVLEGLWYGAGMDAVGQASRIITGAQHEWNWAEFRKAAGEGAVAGAVMSGLGGAARFAGGRSAVVKALFNVMDGKVDNPSAMTRLAGFGARVGLNSATGFAGNLASQAAFDDGTVNWTQAGSFAVGMAVMGEGISRLTPGEHAAAPGTDIPAAIDEARPPSGVQAALNATVHDHSPGDPAPNPDTHAATPALSAQATTTDATGRAPDAIIPADVTAAASAPVHLASSTDARAGEASITSTSAAQAQPPADHGQTAAEIPAIGTPGDGPTFGGHVGDNLAFASPQASSEAIAPHDSPTLTGHEVGSAADGSQAPGAAGRAADPAPAAGESPVVNADGTRDPSVTTSADSAGDPSAPASLDLTGYPALRTAPQSVGLTSAAGADQYAAPVGSADRAGYPGQPGGAEARNPIDEVINRRAFSPAEATWSGLETQPGSGDHATNGYQAARDTVRPDEVASRPDPAVASGRETILEPRSEADGSDSAHGGEHASSFGNASYGTARDAYMQARPEGPGRAQAAGPGGAAGSHSGADTGPAEQLDARGLLAAYRDGQDVSGIARLTVAGAGEAGRAAVTVMDKYGVGLEFSDGGGTYYEPAANVIHIDLSRQSEHYVSSVVYHAAYVRWERDGLDVPITSLDRAAFVRSNLLKEAAAAGDAEVANLDLRNSHPELGLPETERARVFASGSEDSAQSQKAGQPAPADGYDGGARQAAETPTALRGQTPTSAERAAAPDTAGHRALREWYESGDALAPTGESFRDYYGRLWDEQHGRAILMDAGPEGLRAMETVQKYNVKIEYSPGDGTAYLGESGVQIDPTDGKPPAVSVVWAATKTRWEQEKLGVPLSSPEREAYVQSGLLGDAEAAGDAEVAYQHMLSSNPHLGRVEYERGRVFSEAYHDARRQTESAASREGRTAEAGELAEAGEAAGRKALRDWFLSDQAKTMKSGAKFRDIYEQNWDSFQSRVQDPNVRELFSAVDEGRDTSEFTRRILADGGNDGQVAQETLDTNNVKVEYSHGRSTYHNGGMNKINIGLDNGDYLIANLAHEATHSQFFHTGQKADIDGPRDQYVHGALEEEAKAAFNQVTATKAYRSAHPELDLPPFPLEKEFDRAYEEGVQKAEADADREGRTLQAGDRAAAGDAAALTAAYEHYARAKTSNTGEVYVDYYQKIWDTHHSPSPPDLQQSLLDAIRNGHPTSSLTRRTLAEAGPKGQEALATLDRYSVTVTYSEGGDSSYDAASNTLKVDVSNNKPGPILVREATRIRWAREGLTADVATQNRDAYIEAKLRAETDSTTGWWIAFLDVKNARSNPNAFTDDVVKEFIGALSGAAREAEISAVLHGRTLTPGESAAAGEAAARNFVYEALRSGRIIDSGKSYTEQYQHEWDEYHKGHGANPAEA
jgi:hypothetical protein